MSKVFHKVKTVNSNLLPTALTGLCLLWESMHRLQAQSVLM